ncbi:hypothetical protein [Hyphococcus luteus]|uniref:AMIN domain-containing protein n=1 Tax=Hyphococcus luteus TaxID=2058213 RepID=A0A2S7K4L5_9PROT|nr:hypothetical protein [Marinicaulis flavus]PQA87421.1 hypothetical protein CW354_11490 [Marinicaulis flavus]
MRRALLALLLLLVPAAAHAAGETLSVRAGEHGDYSRLVIPNAPTDWRIATSDRKIEITFPKGYDFELSDIIDKRKAHRVLNARVLDMGETRALILSLTCDCPVRTSKGAGNSIVIDIFNKAPATLAEKETDPQPEISEAAKNSEQATPESMRAARDRMIALLAEARSQGVVQLKIDKEDETEAPAEETPAPSPQAATPVTKASHAPETFDAPHADGAPEPLIAADLREEHIQQAVLCADPTLFNEPQDDEGEFDFSAITNLRQRYELALDDEERRDLAATLSLAYIHIGFFEEASAVASPLARDGDATMAVAGALADIAAGSKSRASRQLAPYRDCGPFFEMAYAAAARIDDDNVVPMQEKHLAALRPVTQALRAPLAENLGLNAIEHGDMLVAKEFYKIAKAARGSEGSPALVIMENTFAAQSGETTQEEDSQDAAETPQTGHGASPAAREELKNIAQNPGPMQARALALLAEDYQERADAAYEGLLDDIASQTSRKSASLSEARASFAGAKALISAGRLREGVTVLNAAADSAPAAREASRALARSFILNALMEDDETRLEAVAAFFQNRDFLAISGDGDLNIAVARELAAYGANALVDEALAGVPASWRAQADAMKALSHLNSGDAQGALDIAAHGRLSPELGVVAVKAHERNHDRAGAVAAIKSAMRGGAADTEFANAAWRAGDWPLTTQAFEKAPKKQRNADAAARAALAALNAGAGDLPLSVRETLARNPDALAALAHMFNAAPAVNVRAIDLLSDFTQGVAKEKNFMETGLARIDLDAGGEGR